MFYENLLFTNWACQYKNNEDIHDIDKTMIH